MHLFHYYDKDMGPFANLSDLPIYEAEKVHNIIKQTKPNAQSAKRHPSYIEDRHYYEAICVVNLPKRRVLLKGNPHYMIDS